MILTTYVINNGRDTHAIVLDQLPAPKEFANGCFFAELIS